VRAADCVIVVTDHSVIDYAMIGREAKALVDTRHVVPLPGGEARA
jgi:UDP-N-acetyl-D-mannosaminuronate dehydrogenase